MSPGRRLAITREFESGSAVYRLNGRRIRRAQEIERLNALAVPPAWTDVEIARSPRARLLARGTDAAGRVQAIYHPAFRRKQDRAKFDRVLRFAAALPALRDRIDRDLRRRSLSRERVVACVLKIVDEEYFRIGNPEYARLYRSYGVTTLRRKHVRAGSTSVVFDFVGKSGKRHTRRVADPRIARLITRLAELPGPEIFRYLEDDDGSGTSRSPDDGGQGTVRSVESRHVNAYVKRYAGEEFSVKDFRTWGGTLLAASALVAVDPEQLTTATSRAAVQRRIVQQVAERLGNTPAVTRGSYIDPRVFAAAEDPAALDRVRRARSRMRPRKYFSVDEQTAVALVSGSACYA